MKFQYLFIYFLGLKPAKPPRRHLSTSPVRTSSWDTQPNDTHQVQNLNKYWNLREKERKHAFDHEDSKIEKKTRLVQEKKKVNTTSTTL